MNQIPYLEDEINFFDLTPICQTNLGVVIVDMQEDFLGAIYQPKVQKMLDAQFVILDECRRKDLPVAVLEYRGHASTITSLHRELINLKRVEYFKKGNPDGFTNSAFTQQLRTWDLTDLFFMGVNASGCVRKTVKSAVYEGFNVHSCPEVIEDDSSCGPSAYSPWFRENCNYYE